jgi:hypothetical protein
MIHLTRMIYSKNDNQFQVSKKCSKKFDSIKHLEKYRKRLSKFTGESKVWFEYDH